MNKTEFRVFIVSLIVWGLSSIGDSLFYWSLDGDEVIGGPLHNISTLSLIILDLLALYNYVRTKSKIHNPLNRAVIRWFLYALVITIFTSESFLFDLRRLSWWVSIYYLTFKLSITNEHLTNKFINIYFPVLFIGTGVIYILIRLRNIVSFGGDFITSNDVFYISLSIPLLMLIRNSKVRYALLLLSLLLTLYSFKRTAIISVLLCSIVVIHHELSVRRYSPFKKIGVVVAILMIVGGSFVYINNSTGGHIAERFVRIEESGGSGRSEIWSQLIEEYYESPFYKQTFGIGFNQMKFQYHITNAKDGRKYSAHNDYLEMLVDYGWIGLLLYLLIQFHLYKLIKLSKKNSLQNEYLASSSAFIIFTTMCLFSHMFIYPTFHAYLMASFGVINGNMNRLSINSYKI